MRKFNKIYVWIIVLVLAIIIFIILKSPAAGQRQASQNPSRLAISSVGDESPVPNRPGWVAEKSKKPDNNQSTNKKSNPSDETVPVPAPPPALDDYVKPLPIPEPDPVPYPIPPVCPLEYGKPGAYRPAIYCSPCRTPLPLSEVVACIEL